ncbi:MAG: complex I subunit 4 family protein [Candidatus Dormibacteraceae bacterium]
MSALTLFLAATPTPSASASPHATNFGAGVFNFSFLLSLLIWTPVLVAAVMAVLPNPRGRWDRQFRLTAFWTSLALLVLSMVAYSQFQPYASTLSFEESQPWLPALGVTYHLGLDGINTAALVLNGFIGLVAVVASPGVRVRARSYWVLLLLTEAAVNGAVEAQDFFLFALFWSAMIVPLGLLIRGWGGPGARQAASRLVVHWGVGSACLLAAGIGLWAGTGAVSFNFNTMLAATAGDRAQVVIGLLVLVAAASRLALFPFHRWAPPALAEAPPGVAVLIAGSGMRLGGYLLLRLLAQTNQHGAELLAPLLAAMAAATVIWAGLMAFGTGDIRRLSAWLAIIPGGFTALGVAGLSPLSLEGAVLSLFAGGLAAALVVGAAATLSERAQSRQLGVVAGLAARMPRISWLLLLASLTILGLPFAATFPADVMIVLGSVRNQPVGVFGALLGLLLAAAAIAWLIHRVLFGAPRPEAPTPSDSSLAESWYLGILVGALLWVGVFPLGPRLGGIPLFDPGMLNVINATIPTMAGAYAVPTPPPAPIPASPSPSPSAAPSPSPSP